MNVRTYGQKPYHVALVHGGPGAAGSLKIVCETLSSHFNVLEPLQTKQSVEAQIQELKEVLEQSIEEPIVLIGHSWGAMLVYMFASRYPKLVKKIILISSGSLEQKYTKALNAAREKKINALSEEERIKLNYLQVKLSESQDEDVDKYFRLFGAFMEKIESYDPIDINIDDSLFSYQIFNDIWQDALVLRKSGEMHQMGKNIQCEVVAIHGDYDSHPAHGVKASLEKIINNLKFILLEKCGHTPWLEKHAKDIFYKIIIEEVNQVL